MPWLLMLVAACIAALSHLVFGVPVPTAIAVGVTGVLVVGILWGGGRRSK